MSEPLTDEELSRIRSSFNGLSWDDQKQAARLQGEHAAQKKRIAELERQLTATQQAHERAAWDAVERHWMIVRQNDLGRQHGWSAWCWLDGERNARSAYAPTPIEAVEALVAKLEGGDLKPASAEPGA